MVAEEPTTSEILTLEQAEALLDEKTWPDGGHIALPVENPGPQTGEYDPSAWDQEATPRKVLADKLGKLPHEVTGQDLAEHWNNIVLGFTPTGDQDPQATLLDAVTPCPALSDDELSELPTEAWVLPEVFEPK